MQMFLRSCDNYNNHVNSNFSYMYNKNSRKYNIRNNDFDNNNNFVIIDSLVFNDNKDTNTIFLISTHLTALLKKSDNNFPKSNNPIYRPKNV